MDYSQFRSFIEELPKYALDHGEQSAFTQVEKQITNLEKYRATLDPLEEEREISLFRKHCHRLILQSAFGYYVYARPRGYPGDYLTQEMIWFGRTVGGEHRYNGITEVGKLLTSIAFDMAAPRANEHRIRKITGILSEGKYKSVASIGCGSCIELWSLDSTQLPDSMFLLDQDEAALASAQSKLPGPAERYTFCKDNIVKYILRNNKNMHLGSRDLIYSLGLLDYFKLDMAKKIVASLWISVASGGTLLITNAHVDNPTKIWMEWCGDWYLDHKTEDEMREIAVGLDGVSDIVYSRDPFSVYQYLEISKI